MVLKFRIIGLLGLAALFLLFGLTGCQEQAVTLEDDDSAAITVDSAEWVIGNSIQYHGGDFKDKLVEFDFRDKQYKANFLAMENYMTRTSFLGDSVIVDSTTGENALRKINATDVELSEKKSNFEQYQFSILLCFIA